jgi:hypothetical protein
VAASAPRGRCKFLFEDYHRGKSERRCRLPQAPNQKEHWTIDVCGRCAVPELLRRNPCAHLALEGRIERRWRLLLRMRLYAVCTAQLKEIRRPADCKADCPHYRPFN